MIVSPGSGKRGVTDTMSAFREPITRIVGAMFVVDCKRAMLCRRRGCGVCGECRVERWVLSGQFNVEIDEKNHLHCSYNLV